jgi:hypothetical protein
VVAVLAVLLAACSSVPDVVFVEDDSGTPPAPDDSGSSSGNVKDGQAPTPVYSCPGKPPPGGTGICCPDNRLCLGCVTAQCERCAIEACGGGTVCCARNTVIVDCKSASTCN